jgi:hypothetical protein
MQKNLVYLKQRLMQKQKHLKQNKKQTLNVLLLKLRLQKLLKLQKKLLKK